MHGLLPQAATLRKLRLRSAGGDSLRARLHLETALNGVEWQPPGLPPRAVLLVRRLVLAPSPGAALGPRVLQMLQTCADAARRPWLQADAAGSDAVWFVDEAELAACLVGDALRGRLSSHWWWRAVLAGRTAHDWLRSEVLSHGRLLAPVLALLSQRQQAVAWAERWSDAEAQAGLGALVQAHGWAPEVERGSDPRSARPARPVDTTPQAKQTKVRTDVQRLLAQLPELAQVTALRATARQTLAAALMLSRDATWLKSAQGAATWAAWVAQLEAPAATPAVSVSTHQARIRLDVTEAAAPQLVHADPGGAVPARPGTSVQAAAVTAVPGPEDGTALPAQRMAASAAPASPRAGAHAAPDWQGAPRVTVDNVRDVGRFDATEPAHTRRGPPETAPPPPTAEHPPTPHAHADATRPPVDTALRPTAHATAVAMRTTHAGLFYLLNIALALDLYGDFTKPRMQGLALSPWDLLALAGRQWFGTEFERDPLWMLLADLACRSPAQPPGRGFVPPSPTGVPGDWLIDPDWLVPLGPKPAVHWRRTAHRVQARHATGFVVCDLTCGGAAAPRAGAGRWLKHLLAYVCARTALALGCANAAEVPALLCRQTGEVHVTPTAVDVLLPLDTLPVPVRIAGLDRDPGWIPAAGRSVHFHFR